MTTSSTDTEKDKCKIYDFNTLMQPISAFQRSDVEWPHLFKQLTYGSPNRSNDLIY